MQGQSCRTIRKRSTRFRSTAPGYWLTTQKQPKHSKAQSTAHAARQPPTTKRQRTPAAAATQQTEMAANLNAQLEQEAGEELQAYKTLQGHV